MSDIWPSLVIPGGFSIRFCSRSWSTRPARIDREQQFATARPHHRLFHCGYPAGHGTGTGDRPPPKPSASRLLHPVGDRRLPVLDRCSKSRRHANDRKTRCQNSVSPVPSDTAPLSTLSGFRSRCPTSRRGAILKADFSTSQAVFALGAYNLAYCAVLHPARGTRRPANLCWSASTCFWTHDAEFC